ncbi:hypothetical protein FsymDg_2423 [Candidatus Protofrankia datiscae]|uniref:Uncharacterized protein n=1 Tax=Candidatus Protofrankia datiscae TaxID=2716812 RepID=F8B1D3_9ACTN|nr:hypothetical protein FsymDg_2423 [Candidatus Protofrankia datiscae]
MGQEQSASPHDSALPKNPEGIPVVSLDQAHAPTKVLGN